LQNEVLLFSEPNELIITEKILPVLKRGLKQAKNNLSGMNISIYVRAQWHLTKQYKNAECAN